LEKNVAGTTGKNTCYFIGSLLAEGLHGTRPIVPPLRGGAVPEQMPGQASQAFAAGSKSVDRDTTNPTPSLNREAW